MVIICWKIQLKLLFFTLKYLNEKSWKRQSTKKFSLNRSNSTLELKMKVHGSLCVNCIIDRRSRWKIGISNDFGINFFSGNIPSKIEWMFSLERHDHEDSNGSLKFQKGYKFDEARFKKHTSMWINNLLSYDDLYNNLPKENSAFCQRSLLFKNHFVNDSEWFRFV